MAKAERSIRPALSRKPDPAKVTLGPGLREDHREVREGLSPGDRVVLDPPEDLEEGARARAQR